MDVNFYENLKRICTKKGTNVSRVLAKIGLSSGMTGWWKKGNLPDGEQLVQLSQYLETSIDELIFGDACSPYTEQVGEDWVEIIKNIPAENQEICKDFLRTHMVVPSKYSNEKKA